MNLSNDILQIKKDIKKEENIVQIQILQILDIKLYLISSHFKDEKRKKKFHVLFKTEILG